MKNAAEYRQIARENLQGKWGAAVGVTLIFGLIVGALSGFGIGIILVGPLAVGIALFFMRLTRKRNPEISALFEPLNNFFNTFVLGILKIVFIMLWSLLFIIPGIIMSYAYAMSEYIMADDPSVDGMKAIEISKKMMHGKKARLFCLEISIMWWVLLPAVLATAGSIAFTAGIIAEAASGSFTISGGIAIGFALMLIGSIAASLLGIFLNPYYYAAQAAFYEDAKAEYFQGAPEYARRYQEARQGSAPPYNDGSYGQSQYHGYGGGQQGWGNPQGGYGGGQQGWGDPQGGYGGGQQGWGNPQGGYGGGQQPGEDNNNNNNNPPPSPF